MLNQPGDTPIANAEWELGPFRFWLNTDVNDSDEPHNMVIYQGDIEIESLYLIREMTAEGARRVAAMWARPRLQKWLKECDTIDPSGGIAY